MLFPEQSKLPATAYSRQTQYYEILNTFAVVFNTIVSPSILPEMAQTPVQLAIGLLCLITLLLKAVQELWRPVALLNAKFQVITGARNVFTRKCFAFTEIITLQNGKKTSNN